MEKKIISEGVYCETSDSLRIDCIYFTERGQALVWILTSMVPRELVHQNPEALEHEKVILEKNVSLKETSLNRNKYLLHAKCSTKSFSVVA